jgi:hypothetical protein
MVSKGLRCFSDMVGCHAEGYAAFAALWRWVRVEERSCNDVVVVVIQFLSPN